MANTKVIDFKQARLALAPARRVYNTLHGNPFLEYSPAYTVTNEDLRFITNITANKKKPYVLTNCGSGDAPLFYKLAGAVHVDTFDISYCARAVMDIKTAAIPLLRYDEYIYMLHDLHRMEQKSDSCGYELIQDMLPADTKDFINELQGYQLFNNGLRPSNYKELFLNFDEYHILKEKINKPFSFIWDDVQNLHNHLDARYDIINFSNILEYQPDANVIANILKNVLPNLAKDGVVVLDNTWFFNSAAQQKYTKLQEIIKDIGKLRLFKHKKQTEVITFERHR